MMSHKCQNPLDARNVFLVGAWDFTESTLHFRVSAENSSFVEFMAEHKNKVTILGDWSMLYKFFDVPSPSTREPFDYVCPCCKVQKGDLTKSLPFFFVQDYQANYGPLSVLAPEVFDFKRVVYCGMHLLARVLGHVLDFMERELMLTEPIELKRLWSLFLPKKDKNEKHKKSKSGQNEQKDKKLFQRGKDINGKAFKDFSEHRDAWIQHISDKDITLEFPWGKETETRKLAYHRLIKALYFFRDVLYNPKPVRGSDISFWTPFLFYRCEVVAIFNAMNWNKTATDHWLLDHVPMVLLEYKTYVYFIMEAFEHANSYFKSAEKIQKTGEGIILFFLFFFFFFFFFLFFFFFFFFFLFFSFFFFFDLSCSSFFEQNSKEFFARVYCTLFCSKPKPFIQIYRCKKKTSKSIDLTIQMVLRYGSNKSCFLRSKKNGKPLTNSPTEKILGGGQLFLDFSKKKKLDPPPGSVTNK